MQIPPSYTISQEMLLLIAKIDMQKELISELHPTTPIINKIHHINQLKSSLYSARIEGSTAVLEDLDEKDTEQLEIFNILRAVHHIQKTIPEGKKITMSSVLSIHALTMNGIREDAGKIRTESTAIFNQAGVAIYLPPPPIKVKEHLLTLVKYINDTDEQFPLIHAFISHLVFEKIHPFVDGNGRVGRLLIYAMLHAHGYMKGIHVPIDEYLDNHKNDYYYFLDVGLQDPQGYLLFMLQAYYEQIGKIRSLLLSEQSKKETILLPPRQEEILAIIRDHTMVSFDTIRRRFIKIPERTLRYDLK